jgi:hypothetical protein
VEPITVREFFDRQHDSYSDIALLGPGCWLVCHRGFFLVNTSQFVEIVSGDADLTSVLETLEVLHETADAFGPDDSWRNDRFGSRNRAPVSSNEGLRSWTAEQIRIGRSATEVLAELMAAGVNESGARSLTAIALWQHEHRTPQPTLDDLKPYLAGLT